MTSEEYLRARGWQLTCDRGWRDGLGNACHDPAEAVAIQLKRDHDCLVFAKKHYKAAGGPGKSTCGRFGCDKPGVQWGYCWGHAPC